MPQIPYHWTRALEDRFLALLAETGSVRVAARDVGMSPKSAYARRRRDPVFAKRWHDALDFARARLIDILVEAAIHGYTSEGFRNPLTGRYSSRTTEPMLGAGRGLGLLSRLDRSLSHAP